MGSNIFLVMPLKLIRNLTFYMLFNAIKWIECYFLKIEFTLKCNVIPEPSQNDTIFTDFLSMSSILRNLQSKRSFYCKITSLDLKRAFLLLKLQCFSAVSLNEVIYTRFFFMEVRKKK